MIKYTFYNGLCVYLIPFDTLIEALLHYFHLGMAENRFATVDKMFMSMLVASHIREAKSAIA